MAPWKCKFCGYRTIEGPITPDTSFGKCPRCHRPGALIRFDPEEECVIDGEECVSQNCTDCPITGKNTAGFSEVTWKIPKPLIESLDYLAGESITPNERGHPLHGYHLLHPDDPRLKLHHEHECKKHDDIVGKIKDLVERNITEYPVEVILPLSIKEVILFFKKSTSFGINDVRYITNYFKIDDEIFKEWRVEALSRNNVLVRLFINKDVVKHVENTRDLSEITQKEKNGGVKKNGKETGH